MRARGGPVAKFENGRGMGRAGLPFITTIRGQPNSKAEAIHPFLGLLANFATGPNKFIAGERCQGMRESGVETRRTTRLSSQ